MRLFIDGEEYAVQAFGFPGGERHVRIDANSTPATCDMAMIEQNIWSSDDLMDVLLLTDALRRMYEGDLSIRLRCPYLPYARQDRVAQAGEPLSLAVIAGIINSQRYHLVEVWDPHSAVAEALIDRIYAIPSGNSVHDLVVRGLDNPVYGTLIAPDAGAAKKVAQIAAECRVPFIQALKKRNVQTGLITDTVVMDVDTSAGPYLIVDDICDGGRTFIEIAKAVKADYVASKRECPKIDLFVTHGIFSKGFTELRLHIDHIYVDNSQIHENELPSDFVTNTLGLDEDTDEN